MEGKVKATGKKIESRSILNTGKEDVAYMKSRANTEHGKVYTVLYCTVSVCLRPREHIYHDQALPFNGVLSGRFVSKKSC